jgi:GNAT superfamily N-acetyltransferase
LKQKSDTRRVLACFTLLPGLQEIGTADAGAGVFTAILLNVLAVDQQVQGQGIGRWILSQLMLSLVRIAETRRLEYLLIDPLDDDARAYYQHLDLGFISWGVTGKLVLPVETMRRAISDIPMLPTNEI